MLNTRSSFLFLELNNRYACHKSSAAAAPQNDQAKVELPCTRGMKLRVMRAIDNANGNLNAASEECSCLSTVFLLCWLLFLELAEMAIG